MKLVSNCSVLVPTAALGLPMLDALDIPGMRGGDGRGRGTKRSRWDAPSVTRSCRSSVSPRRISRTPIALVDTMLDVLYDRFVVAGATTTVLQDWRRGRRSEVGDLNGLVAAEGVRLGVPTPVNRAVVEVAHRIERGELAPDPRNAALPRAAR